MRVYTTPVYSMILVSEGMPASTSRRPLYPWGVVYTIVKQVLVVAWGRGEQVGEREKCWRRGSLTLSSACGVGGGPGSSSGISGSVSRVRIRWNGGSRVCVCGVFPLCLVFLLP